jgi:branched-chain amino acid transport system substrate-binding protein
MKRWIVVLGVFLLVILSACGSNEGEKSPAPSVASTTIIGSETTPTPIPTSTPTSAGPVKIGAIAPWSGPMAMSGVLADQVIALVSEQVKNMGGILGGREVKFIRGDDRGVVAESAAQATKLILEEKVTILTLGGVSAASFAAVSNVAEELKVPFVAFSIIWGVSSKKYSACLYGAEAIFGRTASFIIDVVKPKTIAWLAYEGEDSRQDLNGVEGVKGVRERLKENGIDIVYEQYFPQGTTDFSSYLTKIKYLKPDLLVTKINDTGIAITINKQITELGGWGNIKYFGSAEASGAKSAVSLPSALGTYNSVQWIPGSDDPGMKAFEDAFTQKYNRLPDPSLTYFYNCFWTAIKAIELAGTDNPDKVAQALRSGNLEWDSPWGHLRMPPEGTGEVKTMVAQVQEGGKLLKVWP